MTTPASKMDLDRRLWNRDANKFAWNAYLGDIQDSKRTSYMAAAREKDLSGLPPAYTCVGELDIFRDDTVN
jgi:acetyl esterase/lipase